LIVSDLENISTELLEDHAGEAFRVGDAGSLAEVLTRLAAQPAVWGERRQAARASYDARYSPAVDVRNLEAVYADLLPVRV
jgi:hypothetical protein